MYSSITRIFRLLSPPTVAALLFSGVVVAQTEALTPADPIQNLAHDLDIIELDLQRSGVNKSEIEAIRQHLEFISNNVLKIRSRAMVDSRNQRRLLNAFGSVPEEGAPQESEEIVIERKKLEDLFVRYEGQVKAANVVLARVDAVRRKMTEVEFAALARLLKIRTHTPLSLQGIMSSLSSIPTQLQNFTTKVRFWWSTLNFNQKRMHTLIWWLSMLAVVLAVTITSRRWMLDRYGIDENIDRPSFLCRFRAVGVIAFGNLVLPVASVWGLYWALDNTAGFTPEVHEMVVLLAVALLEFFLITGLSAAVLVPRHSNWRISDFTEAAAISLHRAIVVFAAAGLMFNIIGVPFSDNVSLERFGQFGQFVIEEAGRDPLQILFAMIALLVMVVIMLNVLKSRHWQFVEKDADGEVRVVGEYIVKF